MKTIIITILLLTLNVTAWGQVGPEKPTPIPQPTATPTSKPDETVSPKPGTNIREFKAASKERWYFAYNALGAKKVFHYGALAPGLQVATGQPTLEIFSSEEELRKRVDAYAGQGYYDAHRGEE